MSNISNDSGLEDSATYSRARALAGSPQSPQSPQSPRSPSPRPPSPPPYPPQTRLSWFLAEVDTGMMKSGRPNGRTRLCVLRSNQTIEVGVTDKHMIRTIELRVNGRPLEAKLVLASDDRNMVEAAMLAMKLAQRKKEEDMQSRLVQYEEKDDESGKRLVHQVLPPELVDWHNSKRDNKRSSDLVRTLSGYTANVLYDFAPREYLEKQLLHLKACCFDEVFNDTLGGALQLMDDDTWMLVQYVDSGAVIHKVLQFKNTMWRERNLFKDVVAYMRLNDSETVVQGIVIAYSQSKAEMEEKYEQIRSFALDFTFPEADVLEYHLQQAHTTTNLFARNRTTIFERNERRDVNGEHRHLRLQLEQLTERANDEAHMILEAFNMVENIKAHVPNAANE